MTMRKTIFLCLMTMTLLAGTFCLGRHVYPKQIVEPRFEIFDGDSLGVYRVVGTSCYASCDGSMKVCIAFIQLGERDSFYQLRISSDKESCYGHLSYSEEGKASGSFFSSERKTPVFFYEGEYDDIYIVIDDEKTLLKMVSDIDE